MTKEKPLDYKQGGQEISSVGDQIKKIWEQASKEIEQTKIDFENSNPPCPIDGTPGKYIDDRGAYTRVRGVFKCKNGHEFYLG